MEPGSVRLLNNEEAKRLQKGEAFFLGRSMSEWIRINYVMELFGAKDADDLARMLKGRGNPWTKDPLG